MRLRTWLVALSMMLGLALSAASGNAETCTSYPDSIVFDFPGYGPGCVNEGPGCTECVTTASRGVKICYWTDRNEAIYCYYSGQYPDNQIG
jgi:hypothetical protein